MNANEKPSPVNADVSPSMCDSLVRRVSLIVSPVSPNVASLGAIILLAFFVDRVLGAVFFTAPGAISCICAMGNGAVFLFDRVFEVGVVPFGISQVSASAFDIFNTSVMLDILVFNFYITMRRQ